MKRLRSTATWTLCYCSQISKNLNQESKKSDYKSKNQVENSVKFEQEQKTSINRDVPDENYEQGKPNSVDEMLQLLIKSKEALLHAQLINNIIIHDI